MRYYNYHAKAKNLIKNGFLTEAKIVKEYKGISPALVLFFKNNIPMPIREYRWQEYFVLFEEYDIKIKKNIYDNIENN